MQEPERYLTKENITLTAKVIQALDILSEQKANENDQLKSLKISESDIAEMAEEMSKSLPSNIFLIDGNGYRMMFSIAASIFSIIGRDDLQEIFLKAREGEM